MIIELGHYALILSVMTALVQCAFPLWGAVRQDPWLQSMARISAFVTFALVVLSYSALTYAYLSSDFSVANVVLNSHSTKPLIYKISGVWSNHEGSMMLWVLILTFFAALVAFRSEGMPERLLASVLSVQGAIAFAFLIFIPVKVFSQTNCANAAPFCTGTTYNFPAGVNNGTAPAGPDYNCLGSEPNPVWYYLQVANSGTIDITITNSNSVDVDFCLWGPDRKSVV